jgi:hypothetical protein
MVEEVWELTPVESIVNVAEDWPDKTFTVEGTVADLLLLESETEIPLVPAGAFSFNVPTELLPPAIDAGLSANDASVTGLTVRVADFEVPLLLAVIETVAFEVTTDVLTVNVAEVAPAATETVDGTVVPEALEVMLTANPPVGAGLARVTVPVLVLPPMTEVGLSVRPVMDSVE